MLVGVEGGLRQLFRNELRGLADTPEDVPMIKRLHITMFVIEHNNRMVRALLRMERI